MFNSPPVHAGRRAARHAVVTGAVAALTAGHGRLWRWRLGRTGRRPRRPTPRALSKAGGVTKVTFWHAMDGTNAEVLTKLVDAFNKANAGKIQVEATYVGKYDDAIAKYKASIQSKSTPDVVQVYDIGTRFMIDAGQTVPMQDFIDRDKVDMSDLQPNIAGYYSVDKKLYSMPFNTSMPVLYINEKLFKEAGLDPAKPPTTLAEIRTAAEKLSKKNGGPADYGFGAAIYGWLLEQFIAQNGETTATRATAGTARPPRSSSTATPASRSSPGGRRWSRTAWPPTPAATPRPRRPRSSPASWR